MTIHMHREIDRLKRDLLSLSAKIEEAVGQAVSAVQERDEALARWVVTHDDEIDSAEVELEESCLKTLALYQPVAHDLRLIIAVLKINSDLERIGDLASTIAERAIDLVGRPRARIHFDIQRMAGIAQQMLTRCLDAFVREDVTLARSVLAADDEIDALYRDFFHRIVEAMREATDEIEAYVDILGVCRALERIADHATNIAEDTIYLNAGMIVRHRSGESGDSPVSSEESPQGA